MTTVISLSGGINGAYNLWNTAKSSNVDIIAVNVDLPYSGAEDIHGNFYFGGNTSAAAAISSWVNDNIRPVTFVTLSLNNYDPEYSGIGSLEVVNYSLSLANTNSIILPDGLENNNFNGTSIRNAVSKISNGKEIYPLLSNNKSCLNAISEMPPELLAICNKNKFYTGIQKLKSANVSDSEIITKINNIQDDKDINNFKDFDFWFYEDADFGNILLGRHLYNVYPHFIDMFK
jgi:hypothetical protein